MSGLGFHSFSGYDRADRARECVGLSYGDPARRPAYLAHQYPGDTASEAARMGRDQYGCLLHCRGLLHDEGLDDDIAFRGKLVDALDGPYEKHVGLVETLLQEWCKQRGGGIRRYDGPNMPEFDVGEIVVVAGPIHGCCVLEQSDEIVVSSDGGQSDPLNQFRPTLIAERTRRLERIGGHWHLGGRPLSWGWR